VAIGISTGTNSLFLGYLAAGMQTLTVPVLLAAVGVALIILSLYPTSQLYQMKEDRKRGDHTFAIRYGFWGVLRFFALTFPAGVILIALSMFSQHRWISLAFLITGFAIGYWMYKKLGKLTAEREDYNLVMRIKFSTSLSFVMFLLFTLLIKHSSIGIETSLKVLLQ
jgi:1,4-dihydroxy-2-naphthoate octaprenyltransferase